MIVNTVLYHVMFKVECVIKVSCTIVVDKFTLSFGFKPQTSRNALDFYVVLLIRNKPK